MREIKKSVVTNNALRIPSGAGNALGVEMYAFIRKNISTMKEAKVVAIRFRDKKGEISQTEDIVFNVSLPYFEVYGTVLKETVNVNGKNTNCIKELKEFIRKNSHQFPTRMFYNKGYGWEKEGEKPKIRFNGSSIVGGGNIIMDDYEHHLSKKGELASTVKACNEVMRDRVASQLLIASSLYMHYFIIMVYR